LLALRRATQNLAAVLLEEGDWQRSVAVVTEGHRSDVQGGHTLNTGYSDEALRAYYTGDFDAFAVAADAFADTPGGQWDMQIRGLRAVLRVLREEPGGPHDLAEALAAVRGGGFHRPLWTALAMAALCRAMQDRRAEAADLIGELVDSWRKVPVIASGEWVGAAAFAAALAGPDAARALRVPVAEQEHHHRWSEAALHTLHGAIALAEDDPSGAGRHHLAAAEVYAGIPSVTDRMLALVLAVAASTGAGSAGAAEAEAALAQVRAFAGRNRAPGLLRLTGAPG
jgi:hypothetical protein